MDRHLQPRAQVVVPQELERRVPHNTVDLLLRDRAPGIVAHGLADADEVRVGAQLDDLEHRPVPVLAGQVASVAWFEGDRYPGALDVAYDRLSHGTLLSSLDMREYSPEAAHVQRFAHEPKTGEAPERLPSLYARRAGY